MDGKFFDKCHVCALVWEGASKFGSFLLVIVRV